MTLTFKEIIEDLRNAKEENIIIKAFICFITSSIFLVLLGGGGASAIKASVIVFIGMFMLIFLWAAFWNTINILIPTTFSAAFNTLKTTLTTLIQQ